MLAPGKFCTPGPI